MEKELDSNLTIEKRVKKILKNKELKDLCARLIKNYFFYEKLIIVKKIADISIKDIRCDLNLIRQQVFTLKDAAKDIKGFYYLIDELAPNGINLMDRLAENIKYVTEKPTLGKEERSSCSCKKDELGNIHKEIYWKSPKGMLFDTQAAIHEFCHSFCETFMSLESRKDFRVAEVPSVITDSLSLKFLIIKYPQYKDIIEEAYKHMQKYNVKVARECLMEATFVNFLGGRKSVKDLMNEYNNFSKGKKKVFEKVLNKIEKNKFSPMFESRYFVPFAIALEMEERFDKMPKLVASQLKHLIQNNHCMTEEETLAYLGLPDKYKLIDNYVAKFPERIFGKKDKTNNVSGQKPQEFEK